MDGPHQHRDPNHQSKQHGVQERRFLMPADSEVHQSRYKCKQVYMRHQRIKCGIIQQVSPGKYYCNGDCRYTITEKLAKYFSKEYESGHQVAQCSKHQEKIIHRAVAVHRVVKNIRSKMSKQEKRKP